MLDSYASMIPGMYVLFLGVSSGARDAGGIYKMCIKQLGIELRITYRLQHGRARTASMKSM